MDNSFEQRATVLKHKAEEIAKKLLKVDNQAATFIKPPAPPVFPKSSDPSEYRLFVKNLRPETTEETLKGYFGRWGKVSDVFIRQSQWRFLGSHCNMGVYMSDYFDRSSQIAQLFPTSSLRHVPVIHERLTTDLLHARH